MSEVMNELANGMPKYKWDNTVKGWGYGYYFLYEYELANSPLGVSPLPLAHTEAAQKTTIEHILPQKHRDSAWWQNHWPDEAEADRFKHRFGNLTVTVNNSVLGRKPIHLKFHDPQAKHDFNHANASNSEKQVRQFTDGSSWTAENIIKREFAMMEFAIARWAFGCCCDNGTIELPLAFGQVDPNFSSIVVLNNECIQHIDEPELESVDNEEMDDDPRL